MTTTDRIIWWGGVRKSGSHVCGWTAVNTVESFVERRYRLGDRELVVEAPDGTQVGGITTNDDGRRVWWGER